MSTINRPWSNSPEQLQNPDQLQWALSFQYQSKLDLPQEVTDRITPTLNKRYKDELKQFDAEQHQAFADSLHMIYILDQSPVEWVQYDQAQQSTDQTVRNNSLLCMIEDIPISTEWAKIPLDSIIAFGEEAKSALSSTGVTIQQALSTTKIDQSTEYSDEELDMARWKEKRKMKRANKKRGKTIWSDQHQDTLDAISKTHDTMDYNNDGYVELGEESPEATQQPENRDWSQELSYLSQNTSPENTKINESLSIFAPWMTLEHLEKKGQEFLEKAMEQMFTQWIITELENRWIKLSSSEKKEYIDGILDHPWTKLASYTIMHAMADGFATKLRDALNPSLNTKDAMLKRANVLKSLNDIIQLSSQEPTEKSKQKMMGIFSRTFWIDQKTIDTTENNITMIVSSLVKLQTDNKEFITEIFKETQWSISVRKKETWLEVWRQVSAKIIESLDNYDVLSDIIDQSLSWEAFTEAKAEWYARLLLSQSNDESVQITSEDSQELLNTMSEVASLIPDWIEDKETFKKVTKELYTQRTFNSLDSTVNWKMISWFTKLVWRDFAEKHPQLYAILEAVAELLWFEIWIDDLHDRVDAWKVSEIYEESENEHAVESTCVESESTEYEYNKFWWYLLKLPFGSNDTIATKKYRSQDQDNMRWYVEDDGKLTYHQQLDDGTVRKREQYEAQGISSIHDLILHDFNPVAFLESATAVRWVENIHELQTPSLLSEKSDADTFDTYQKATTDLAPHIKKILATHHNLNDQEDLVWLLMYRIQKEWRFDEEAPTTTSEKSATDTPEAPEESDTHAEPIIPTASEFVSIDTWLTPTLSIEESVLTYTYQNAADESPSPESTITIDLWNTIELSDHTTQLLEWFDPNKLLTLLDTIHTTQTNNQVLNPNLFPNVWENGLWDNMIWREQFINNMEWCMPDIIESVTQEDTTDSFNQKILDAVFVTQQPWIINK